MSAQPLPKFDSAEYEALLTEAGVDKVVAQAHRKGLALSQEHLVTSAELRAAINEQTSTIRATIIEQTRWFVTCVAGIVAVATTIIKLTGS